MSCPEDEQISRQRAQFEPSSSSIGESFSLGADNGSNVRGMRSNDSSFELQDDRDYVRCAFKEIEDEIDLNPEWWRRNIEVNLVWIQLLMFLWSIIYLLLLRPIGTVRKISVVLWINFIAFHFFLCFLFFLVRKFAYWLCAYYRLIRSIEKYKNICKRFFFVLVVPALYFFCVYICWLISDIDY
jgi:hypothetical protein